MKLNLHKLRTGKARVAQKKLLLYFISAILVIAFFVFLTIFGVAADMVEHSDMSGYDTVEEAVTDIITF